MSNDLVFEIGTEELPAHFIPKALWALEELFKKRLDAARLGYKALRCFGSPRRLAVIVDALDALQPDSMIEVRGPQKKAAFDAEGKPADALLGFLRSQGAELKDLKTVSTDKGEYLCLTKQVNGAKTVDLLPEILSSALNADYSAKTMRWGNDEATFARPVHWIVAVYDGNVVDLEWGRLRSDNKTYGHRFMSGSKEVHVSDGGSYVKGLKDAFVIADQQERKRKIVEGVEAAAAECGGVLLKDDALVDEVSCLVEYPVALLGEFEEEFLELPREVVVNAMREHQRYFAVVNKDGSLLPRFITVANTKAINMAVVRKGNERVLRARLNDASFYFEKDMKTRLVDRVESLKGVVFHARLGTSYEKVERFTQLAVALGNAVGFCDSMNALDRCEDFLTSPHNPATNNKQGQAKNKDILGRAAMLAKADLVSGMVGEFPKLQGIMGREYARRGNEAKEVSEALCEHYLPTSSGGALPASVPGALISVADKLDTICGCFSVGLIPTGAQDPYGLRRSALGIIAIINDKGWSLNLPVLIRLSVGYHKTNIEREINRGRKEPLKDYALAEAVHQKSNETERKVCDFFIERLRNWLLGQSMPFDTIDAVLSAVKEKLDVADAVKRIEALEGFKTHPACASLIIASKRVSNILKGVDTNNLTVDHALLADQYEKALDEAEREAEPIVKEALKNHDYPTAFVALAAIKGPIDLFFDKVMVMTDDEKLRSNRLALLSLIRGLYFNTADLSRLNA
ncbi:MAG: glycine--tRNA ligase subunit beta [Deltaproteobacteria bacterium]|nr:glycine--tRNA ligase subunit beta [Deltaproteobacteria bacterium]